MRLRRALVGVALVTACDGLSSSALALSCAPLTLLQQTLAAAGVFEATVKTVTGPEVGPLPVAGSPDIVVAASSDGPVFMVALDGVVGLRGESAGTIRQYGRRLRPGTRYVFFVHRRPEGDLTSGSCLPIVATRRAAGLKAWLTSLAEPPAGGHLFGSVVIPPSTTEADDETPVAAARVVARGPVVVETTSDADGHFAFTGLPHGNYEVSATPGDERSGLTIARTATVVLSGDHAAASADFFATVNGTVSGRVVDEAGRPVAKQLLRLSVAASTGDPERSSYGFATTGADGMYVATGVRPGRYLLSLDEPSAPSYASTADGKTEIVVGWADHVEMQPLVARRGMEVSVSGTFADTGGRPREGGVLAEILGPHGVYPAWQSSADIDGDGSFRLRLLHGARYRFTAMATDGSLAMHEQVIDGTPIRLTVVR